MKKWIEAKQQKPTDDMALLLYWDNGVIESGWFENGFFQHADGEMDYHREERVTHWMKLPPPPIPHQV